MAEKSQDCQEPVVFTHLPLVEVVEKPVRVGVAHDPAFCFYYPDNLALFEQAGGSLSRFSPIHDDSIPDVDVLYFGGGYPRNLRKSVG